MLLKDLKFYPCKTKIKSKRKKKLMNYIIIIIIIKLMRILCIILI